METTPHELPFNLAYVEKRARVIMAKMRKEPEFQEALLAKFDDYVLKGFYEEVGPLSEEPRTRMPGEVRSYIPMHAVVTPEKTRLVADAAAKCNPLAGSVQSCCESS